MGNKHNNYSKYSAMFNKPENKEPVEQKESTPMEEVHKEIINEIVNSTEVTVDPNDVLTEVEVNELKEDEVAEVDTDGNLTGVVVNCEKLRLRSEASVKSISKCLINKGTELSIIDEEGDFYKVVLSSGDTGYCMKQFIEIK